MLYKLFLFKINYNYYNWIKYACFFKGRPVNLIFLNYHIDVHLKMENKH